MLSTILSFFPFVSSNKETTTSDSASAGAAKKKAVLYSFQEARKMARGHGFESQQEFLEYYCPGAYQLPKNPQEVWAHQWLGWDDFLGISLDFSHGRRVARALPCTTQEEYMEFVGSKRSPDDDPASRLPIRPDLKYTTEWKGWDDWLVSKD